MPEATHTVHPSRWRFAVPALLVIIVLLVFVPALESEFLQWDDHDLLFKTDRYKVLNQDNLRWMFTTSYAGHFQPLTWLSYALDYTVWGLDAFIFHLSNVVLHILTTVAFYFVSRRLLAISVGEGHYPRTTPLVLSAGLAAALFAVHPLRAESVAWVSERRDVLGGLFYVLAIGAYLRYATTPGSGQTASDARELLHRRFFFYVGAIALCTLSLLAKATAVTLPAVLLILDWYPLKRLGGERGFLRVSSPRVWMEKLPFFALAAAGGVRAVVAQDEGGALYSLADHGLLARIAQASYGLVFYVWKTVLPTNLGPIYEIPPRHVLLGTMFWVSLAVVVLMGAMCIRWRRRHPAVTAAFAAYVVIVAPVLGFLQSGPQLVADRYSYLSCMGLALLAGGALLGCVRSSWWKRSSYGQVVVVATAVGVLMLAEQVTFWHQAAIWKHDLSLWEQAVRVSPNSSIAHVNYADALAQSLDYRKAYRHYREGLTLDPEDPVALHHLGDLYRLAGETNLAIGYYIHALRVDPNRSVACYSLAQLFRNNGRVHDAVNVLHDGIMRHPDDLNMIAYLTRLLSTHPDETVRDGKEAVKLAQHLAARSGEEDPLSLVTLGAALAEAGRFEEAVEVAQRALVVVQKKGADRFVSRLNVQLALYRNRQPYHTAQ